METETEIKSISPSRHGKAVSTQWDLYQTFDDPTKSRHRSGVANYLLFDGYFRSNNRALSTRIPMLILPNRPPTAEHWLGTTGQGQDVFSQMVYGSRISLLIGFSVGILSTLSV